MKKRLLGVFLLFCCQQAIAISNNTLLYQWTEFAPNNQMQKRLITTDTKCPDPSMQATHTPFGDFLVTVCQKSVPADKNFSPKKIVIFGDTGCRIKNGINAQDCDDPKKWPFPQIIKSAAKWHPDLVIHVGDYLYRESPCPKGDKECASSPSGDKWATWEADFFKPAKPLLSEAPWVFVRGNHETCDRAGRGWEYLLDPYNFKHCMNYSPVYSIDMGDTRMFIIDSANASDLTASVEQTHWYENYLQHIYKSKAKNNWVVTHKPFWFVYSESPVYQTVQKHVLSTLQAAWMAATPNDVDLLMSGHIHRFQTINLSDPDKYPPQLIAGMGGTTLDTTLENPDLKGLNVAGKKVASGLSLNRYGYVTMERKSDDIWKVVLHDPYGKVVVNCYLKNHVLSCNDQQKHHKANK